MTLCKLKKEKTSNLFMNLFCNIKWFYDYAISFYYLIFSFYSVLFLLNIKKIITNSNFLLIKK